MRFLHVAHVLDGNALVLGDDDFAGLGYKVETRDFSAQALWQQFELDFVLVQAERIEHEKFGQNLLRRIAKRLQQDSHRHLAAPVDTEIQVILGIVLEIEPRAAIRNDARREQQLARRMGLAPVVLEEYPGRAVQLRHDHALSAVDDERARRSHERYFTHVHFLFLDFFHRRLGSFLVHDREAHFGAQRRRKGKSALLTFLDVERRLAEHEAHEFEACILGMALDRENALESRLQPLRLTRVRRYKLL